MSHTRPSGTGWVTGQQGEPVEVLADPPGDGIGPDLTPPDAIGSQDPKELKRLEREHRAAVKDVRETAPGEALVAPEPNDQDPGEPTANPFASARVAEPQDPAVELPADPREGRSAR